MKKIILAFLILCTWTSLAFGGMLMQSVSGDAGSYDDITFWWRCEGTTLGADDYYGTGDNTATATGAVAINTDAVKIGTNGIDCPTSQDYYTFDVSSDDLISGSEGIIGFWIYITTWSDYAKPVIVDATTGHIKVTFRDSDEIRIVIDDGSEHNFTTTSNPLTTLTWYFIEVAWKDSTNLVEIYVSENDGNRDQQLSTTGTAWATPIGEDALEIGITENQPADWYIDNFMVSNDSTRNLYLLRNETESPR